MKQNSSTTKDWDLYKQGINFNRNLEPNYYNTVDANWDFYNGNQWRNIDAENMPKPVFNIIKRIITFMVASLTSSKTVIHFEPMTGIDEENRMSDPYVANAAVDNLLEKFKFDSRLRDALFDAAITGDAAAHFYWDMDKKPYGDVVNLSNGMQVEDIQGEICMELVDGVNVFFGNANITDVQSQPYVIIAGREMTSKLNEEKKQYMKISQDKSDDEAQADDEYNDQIFGQEGQYFEIESDKSGKSLYIIVYRKKKVPKTTINAAGRKVIKEVETVFASKSVEKTYIYKDVDTGLSKYPVSWMNWEKQKNQYHGRAICTGILPNQIFINRMFAMVMYHLMMTAFPKAIYNADYIEEWDNEVGSAIAMSGLGLGESIKNVAGYLEPGNMSSQIVQVIELAMNYTKETLGINDVSLGNTNLDNTSAIIAIQRSASIPLENPKSNMYQWVEDIGEILFDMMGTYYGLRPVVMELPVQETTGNIIPGTEQVDEIGNPIEGTGQPETEEKEKKQVVMYDFSKLKNIWLNTKVDVGEGSYWSEISANTTLTNLLQAGHIDIIEFLERISDNVIPNKQDLISDLKERMEKMKQQQEQQMQMDQQMKMMQQQQQVDKQNQKDQTSAIQRQEEIALKHRELDIKDKKVSKE